VVEWIYNFAPAAGDSFVIMEFAAREGTFATVSLPDLPAGLDLLVDYRDEAIVLQASGSEVHATIHAVADVPDDQGGFVEVSWYASTLDDPGGTDPVTEYEIQEFDAAWQAVGTVPATGAPFYSAEVPTGIVLVLGEDEPWGYYRILARAGAPGVFYSSPSDSGYSVDNLPPPPPLLVLLEDTEGRTLTWSNPGVPDLAHTCLYRIDALGVLADSLMTCTSDTAWTETHQFFYDYYCRAVDVHGNVGGASDVVEHLYPTDAAVAPAIPLGLAQNFPNPFNPATTIRYGLSSRQEVRLDVFDVSGRRVRTLVGGKTREAGLHAVVFDGRDDAGRSLASGTYFYRLQADARTATRRMILIK
jgi:hypothetical protein